MEPAKEIRRIVPKRRGGGKLLKNGGMHPDRLGDKIGAALATIGVTPERWQAIKAEIGLPPTCHCEERKQWLNELDRRLSLREKLERFMQAIGWR